MSSLQPSRRPGRGSGIKLAPSCLFEQLDGDELWEIALLLGVSEPGPGFISYLKMTPPLQAGFSLGEAACAYMDCVRSFLD
jgi:hypothetical protein